MMNLSLSQAPPPWADGPYSIKRHGTTITHCASEPIQAPGCIQHRGVLLVLRLADLTILQASENTLDWFGLPPESLLGKTVAAVVGPEREACLRQLFAREPVERNPLYAFTLPARGTVGPLDVVVHTINGLGLVEFESIGIEAVRTEPDYYALLKKTVTSLQAAAHLADFCHRVTQEVRLLTGLDRVMVYQFHADDHGEVVAESKRDDLPSWLGLHYPADDIPPQVRAFFQKIWIRPLPDAHGPLVEMIPLTNPDTGTPVDMTYCSLRGASVMYTEYLRNMGVAATLTLPIHREGKLWGLIACHHYTPTMFPYQIRAACEFLAQLVSFQLKPIIDRGNMVYQLKLERVHNQLLAGVGKTGEIDRLTSAHPNLLDGIEAGGAAVYYSEHWWLVGRTPAEPELEALVNWLSTRPELGSPTRPVYVTDALAHAYPEAVQFADIASGLLAVSLSNNNRNLILWFRPETIQTVNWAGSPHDKPTVSGPNGMRLTPRTSFKLFAESVRAKSLPWKEVEIAAALQLRVSVMNVVVSRFEQLAALNVDLMRSNQELDTFAYVASHDLKEPLRGISKYAHQVLDSANAVDDIDRKRLEALIRLTQRMDGLLSSLLHFSRVGRIALAFDAVDLNGVVEESLEMVAARRAESQAEIVIPRSLPTVEGDRERVREIFVNLISNALKYTDKPQPQVEIGFLSPEETGWRSHAPKDVGKQIMFYVKDNGIGIEARHYEQVFRIFKRLHGRDDYGGGTGTGLAVVKTLVDRHHGRVWIDSTPGEGSTFFFTLGASREHTKATA